MVQKAVLLVRPRNSGRMINKQTLYAEVVVALSSLREDSADQDALRQISARAYLTACYWVCKNTPAWLE